jgi:hypothetical protein
MKSIGRMMALALMTAQVAAGAAPAMAADVNRHEQFTDTGRGAFAGLRFKMPLGGSATGESRARVALTLTPTAFSRVGARTASSMGEGLELGFSPGSKAELTLSGQRLDRMALFVKPREDPRANVSTVAKVAIVTGVVLVVGAVAFYHVASEASCFHGGGSSGDC